MSASCFGEIPSRVAVRMAVNLPYQPLWQSLPIRVSLSGRSTYAPVAQRIRASDFESEGRGFESLRAYHLFYLVERVLARCWSSREAGLTAKLTSKRLELHPSPPNATSIFVAASRCIAGLTWL